MQPALPGPLVGFVVSLIHRLAGAHQLRPVSRDRTRLDGIHVFRHDDDRRNAEALRYERDGLAVVPRRCGDNPADLSGHGAQVVGRAAHLECPNRLQALELQEHTAGGVPVVHGCPVGNTADPLDCGADVVDGGKFVHVRVAALDSGRHRRLGLRAAATSSTRVTCVVRCRPNDLGISSALFRDADHRVGERVERLAALGLGGLDHERLVDDQREVDRRRVEAVVHQPLGDVQRSDPVLRLLPSWPERRTRACTARRTAGRRRPQSRARM